MLNGWLVEATLCPWKIEMWLKHEVISMRCCFLFVADIYLIFCTSSFDLDGGLRFPLCFRRGHVLSL